MRKYGWFLAAVWLAAPGCRELDKATERAADKAAATQGEAPHQAEALPPVAEPSVVEQQPAAEQHPSVEQHAADDSGVNARDRNGALPTPMDQSEKKADLALVRAIRKAVVADDTLSMNARNVKIIVIDGRVTLRGPVRDEAERQEVVAKATLLAGMDRVDDALDVLHKPAGSREPSTPQPSPKGHARPPHQRR